MLHVDFKGTVDLKMIIMPLLFISRRYFILGSQWLPPTVWLPTFFKIFSFVVKQKKETHRGLEPHDSEYIIWVNCLFKCPWSPFRIWVWKLSAVDPSWWHGRTAVNFKWGCGGLLFLCLLSEHVAHMWSSWHMLKYMHMHCITWMTTSHSLSHTKQVLDKKCSESAGTEVTLTGQQGVSHSLHPTREHQHVLLKGNMYEGHQLSLICSVLFFLIDWHFVFCMV